jgi:hypothetical protein
MGSKLLAAFGAGALIASGVFFLATRPRLEPAPPQTIPTVVPPEASEPPATPTKLRPVRPALRNLRPVVAEAAPAPAPPAPASEPPAAVPPPPPVAAADATPPPAVEAAEPAPAPQINFPPPPPKTVTLPAGTLIQIRLAERLATDRNLEGDTFAAVLDHELVVDGWVIAEAGARVYGRITQLDRAGRLKGIASMTLELTSLTTSDGQKIPLRTASFLRKGDTAKGSDIAMIALGTALGAVFGGAAGGGKGAAIGAASGGAAGVGAAIATPGKAAVLDVETRLSFKLDDSVTITERR